VLKWRTTLIAMVLAVGAIGAGMFGAYAVASVPDSSGVIHACYKTTDPGQGELFIVDTGSGGACSTDETSLTWSQSTTAGPNGLDVTIVQGDSGGTFAQATCPSDHPFVLGGGGYIASGTQTVESYPQQLTGEESASNPGSWDANAPNGLGHVVAEAICAK